MIANALPRRKREFSIEGVVRWVMEWWDVSYYGVMFILFVWLIVMPFFSLSETKVRRDFQVMSERELVKGVHELSEMIKNPVRDGRSLYFDIVLLYSTLDAHCYVIQEDFTRYSGYVAGYSLARHDNPCAQLSPNGSIGFKYSEYQLEYRRNMDQKKFDVEAAAFHGVYPSRQLDDIVNARSNTTETTYHTEKLWESYFGGVAWFGIWFLLRIKQKEFCLKWEIMTLRLPCMIVLWPGTFWFYPGDPMEQAREIKRWIGYIFSTSLSFCGFGIASAGSLPKVSAGGSIQSSYIYDNNKLATPGPVIQPWFEAYLFHGLYVGGWASFALTQPYSEEHIGDEIDYTIGYRSSIYGVKLDVSYNYYQFVNGWDGMHAPKITACLEAFSLCGKFQYLIPNTDNTPGMQFGGWWSHKWSGFYDVGTLVGVTHTRDVFDRKPITVLKAELSIPVFKTGVTAFMRGYIPLVGGSGFGDDQDKRVMFGLRAAW